MLEQRTAADEILDRVRAQPGCTLGELTQSLPKWNWSEIFIEVDRLSRLGQLRLKQSGAGFITTLHAL